MTGSNPNLYIRCALNTSTEVGGWPVVQLDPKSGGSSPNSYKYQQDPRGRAVLMKYFMTSCDIRSTYFSVNGKIRCFSRNYDYS